jgi:hypothetical protein
MIPQAYHNAVKALKGLRGSITISTNYLKTGSFEAL